MAAEARGMGKAAARSANRSVFLKSLELLSSFPLLPLPLARILALSTAPTCTSAWHKFQGVIPPQLLNCSFCNSLTCCHATIDFVESSVCPFFSSIAMSSYPALLPHQLPQGSFVTFDTSSFFGRGPHTPKLPTPSEVLSRGDIEHPNLKGFKIRPPVIFKDLGLLVKYGEAPDVTIAEGQCLWAIRNFLPQVPVPEIYGWNQAESFTFLYMEFIDGITLHDRWDTLTPTEKSGVCEQLKTIITEIHHLRQGPNDKFIGRRLLPRPGKI